jgi:hypothetical protein
MNIPFTGNGAIFKTSILREFPFQEHLTEDTNWFSNILIKTKYKVTFQSNSPIFEYLPQTVESLIERRIRWATGHTKILFNTLSLKNLLNPEYLVLLPFYFIGALSYILIIIQALYLCSQLTGAMQLVTIMSFAPLVIFRNHILIAFSPFFYTFLFNNAHYLNVQYYFQSLILSYEMNQVLGSVLLLKIFSLIFLGLIRYKMKPKILIFLTMPFFIIIELYACFIGLINILFYKTNWDIDYFKKNKRQRAIWVILSMTLTLFVLKKVGNTIVINIRAYSAYKDVSFQEESAAKKKQIVVDDKEFIINGIAVNSHINSEKLDKISLAGFNTLRFYRRPTLYEFELLKNYNLKVIIQSGHSNWSSYRLDFPFDRLLIKRDFFDQLAVKRANSQVLFIVLGNELATWPSNLEIHKSEKSKISEELIENLNALFKDSSIKGREFSYSTPLLDKGISFKDIPIPMFNINSFSSKDWHYLRHSTIPKIQKPIVIGEYGGQVKYTNNYYPPEAIRNFIVENNVLEIENANINGKIFFAMQDTKFSPEMNQTLDPFLENESKKTGVLDINSQPKNIFWLFTYLNSKFKVLVEGEKIYLKNKTTFPLDIRKINNFSVNKRISPLGSISLSLENFKDTAEHYISYIDNNNLVQRALFRNEGYLTACKKILATNTTFSFDKKFNSPISFLHIESSKGFDKFQTEEKTIKIDLLASDEVILVGRDIALKTIIKKNEKLDGIIYHQLIPCQKGNPISNN